jgi:hypothetical protein
MAEGKELPYATSLKTKIVEEGGFSDDPVKRPG